MDITHDLPAAYLLKFHDFKAQPTVEYAHYRLTFFQIANIILKK